MPCAARPDADLQPLIRGFAREFPGVGLCDCDAAGRMRHGDEPPGGARVRAQAVADAVRFGEPVVTAAGGAFLWAVPVTCNNRVMGGVVAWIPESALFPDGLERPRLDMRAACARLRELAIAANLSNQAWLDAQRDLHRREADRAAFLHQLKRGGLDTLSAQYLREETALVAAVRAGDRRAGRTIVNRLLVGIYHRAGGSLERAKSLLLELVVMLCRSAAEAGSRREQLPIGQADLAGELAAVRDDIALTRWLVRTIERVFDALDSRQGQRDDELARRALRWIAEHCEQDLSRDMVAEAVGVAPARLTRLLQASAGRGFSDLVNRARIDRAKRLLQEGRSALDVALETGFADPSYFTKVFRRCTGTTPRDWKERFGG